MKSNSITFMLLALCSAVLLSLGFLFPHCGGFALVGFVPLLWMDRMARRDGQRRFWWWHYLCFVMWNALTTWWVCNATVGGGIFAIFANALQMSVIWAVFRLSAKRFSGSVPYVFLAAMWIAWERFYFDAEISWPWLVLGNSFARTTSCIQWYDTTGLLGGSLWIWACNLAVFGLMCAMESGDWKKFNAKARTAAIAGTLIVFVAPLCVSFAKYARYQSDSGKGQLEACVLQPNLDPYQKFESLTQQQQTEILVEQIQGLQELADTGRAMLLVAPETFTNDVFYNDISSGATLRRFKDVLAAYPNANLLFGASAYELFYQNGAPSANARKLHDGQWYESYNAALITDCGPRVEVYNKSKLVVGVEKLPYPAVLGKVDDMLGGVAGRCVGQKEVTLLHYMGDGRKVPLGCAICYESVYPEHFARYVARGAQAMTVITNDAWWGNTAGYKQHLSYSSLRAIETRRCIARSANTGISAFINQRGDIVSQTDWWERQTLCGTMELSTVLTPFVKYGDITGRLCSFVFLLMFFALGVNIITKRRL